MRFVTPLMRPVPRHVSAVAAALLITGMSSHRAFAQTQGASADPVGAGEVDADDGTIVVTARRRVENVQDIPVSVTVLGGDRLEQTNVFTLDQLKQQVPSLQISAINPRNTNINIRNLGSNASVNSNGLDSGVGVYIDDVYYARPGQSVFDLVDIDRIEILKGPQGTLFGRNTTAGALSISTRRPSFTPEATAEISVGNYEYVQARAAVSVPIIDDKIAVRLTASTTVRDGLVKNVRTGRDVLNLDSQALRGQILLKPSADFSVRIIGDYSIRQEDCCVNLPAGFATALPDGTPIANSFAVRATRLGYTLPSTDAFDRITDADAPVNYTVKQAGVSTNTEWRRDAFSLTSITAYRTWDWIPANDIDSLGLSVFKRSQSTQNQKQFTQELRIASEGERTIDYVAGLYYFRQTLPADQITEYGPDAAAYQLPLTLPAAIGQAALDGFTFNGKSRAKTSSYAVFGQVDWRLTPRLTLTAGVRFTHERKSGFFDQRQIGGVDLARLPVAVAAAAQAIRNGFGPESSYTASVKNDNLSGQLSLAYRASDAVLAYATYARGAKSGGINITNPAGVSPIVEPEKVDHHEVGLKTSPAPGVTLNGALFWTEINEFQATYADGERALNYLTNAAKVRSRGGEVELQTTPFRGLGLFASAILADAVYVSYRNAPCPFGVVGTAGICDLSGERLPNAPKWAVSAGGEFSRPVRSVDVFAGTDWSYRTSVNTASNNSPFGTIPGYSIVNARLGLRGGDGSWAVYLFTRNLFDKDYYRSYGWANNGLITATVGEQRTYGVTGRFRF